MTEFFFNIILLSSIIYLIYSIWFYFFSWLKNKNQKTIHVDKVSLENNISNDSNYNWDNQSKIYHHSSYYYKKTKFFSKNESIFFKNLYKILNIIDHHRYIVFSKVRVSDIVWSRSEKNWTKNRAWLKINPWHFDFVVCDMKNDYEPVAVIELDDNSHNDEYVQKRDRTKDEICKNINLPLIRTFWHENLDKIKEELLDVL